MKAENQQLLDLIKAVQILPALWDPNSPQYNNHLEKMNIWGNIAENLKFPDATEARGKWIYLRGEYSKLRRKYRDTPERIKWIYFEHLAFLEEYYGKYNDFSHIDQDTTLNAGTLLDNELTMDDEEAFKDANESIAHSRQGDKDTSRNLLNGSRLSHRSNALSLINKRQSRSLSLKLNGFKRNSAGILATTALNSNNKPSLKSRRSQLPFIMPGPSTTKSIHAHENKFIELVNVNPNALNPDQLNLSPNTLSQGIRASHSGNVFLHDDQHGWDSSTPIINSVPEVQPFTSRDQVIEAIVAEKIRRGLKWEDIANRLGYSKEWATGACLGQLPMNKHQAETIAAIFGLGDLAVTYLQTAPAHTRTSSNLPSDPALYRFYEVLNLYGPALKELIHEEFGHGIMSAVDFNIKMERVETVNGPRVRLVWDGKFLPYQPF